MDKNKVWQQIKNDKSEIYGQSMLDVFLQVTDFLSEPHFLELDKEQRNKLSGNSIYSLLYYATDIKKIADLIGQNINKLSEQHVYELLKKDKSEIANAGYSAMQQASSKDISYDVGSAASTDFASQKYLRKDAILEYKSTNNDRDVYALLSRHSNHINNTNDLNKVIEKIGEEKLNYLSPVSIFKLLKDFSSLDGTGDTFEFFANKLGSNIEKIPADKVIELIPTPSAKPNEGVDRLEKIMKSLGKENLSKLEDKGIKSLLSHGSIKLRKKISELLGQEIDKLSDRSIDELVEGVFININKDLNALAKMVDVIGEERFMKWFKSPAGKETISSFKNGINMSKNEILKNAQSWQVPTLKNNIETKEQMLAALFQRIGQKNE